MSNRIVLLCDEVRRPNVRAIINKLRELDRISDEDIRLIIHTPGGDLSAAWGLIDVMRSLRSDVMTAGFGTIASAGAGIIAAGTPGKRMMGPNAYLMTHQPRGMIPHAAGMMDHLSWAKDHWAELLAELTNNSVLRLEELNDRDTHMTADQALANGFVDVILGHEPKV